MCGVAGIFVDGIPLDVPSFKGALEHRGPDSFGEFLDGSDGIWFYHNRLAIIDRSEAGAQPFWSSCGQFALVFNGEIYNFRELRSELVELGYKFKSDTDTEVVLNLYIEYGSKFLKFLNGIFAFAIWNYKEKALFLARDALGVKPLYYCDTGRKFAFCSELKGLDLLSDSNKSINFEALRDYLIFSHSPDQNTPLMSWKKLLPGQSLLIGKGGHRKQNIWYRPQKFFVKKSDQTISVLAEELKSLFKNAVKSQLVSDVGVGSFLSGGVDSTAIVAIAKEEIPNIQCFCTKITDGVENDEDSDIKYAIDVAREFNVPLNVVEVGPTEFVSNLENLVWHLDEPIADPACITTFAISKEARKKSLPVMLSGTGGDDLFGGYRRHKAIVVSQQFERLPNYMRKGIVNCLNNPKIKRYFSRRVAKFLTHINSYSNHDVGSYLLNCQPDLANRLFAQDIRKKLTKEPTKKYDAYLEGISPYATQLDRAILLDQRFYLGDQILTYTDKLGMASGIEIRVPFLDKHLVEFSFQLSDGQRVNMFDQKRVLKEAVKEFVPDAVLKRPKMGFGVPLRKWFDGPLREYIEFTLCSEIDAGKPIFDEKAIREFVAHQREVGWQSANVILGLLAIKFWLRRFL